MNEKQYFYFADPKSFQYPIIVKLIFYKKDKTTSIYQNRRDKTLWFEAKEYNYYGEPVKCLVPQKSLDFNTVYDLFINSAIKENVFGSINYMIQCYKEKFVNKLEKEMTLNRNIEILHTYFKSDIE